MHKTDCDFLTSVAKKEPFGTFVSLYVHIPFCVQKCRYCDFLSAPADAAVRKRYLAALVTEIRETAELLQEAGNPGSPVRKDVACTKGKETHLPVDTVFIGGGTPSLLNPGEMELLLETIRQNYDLQETAEITMECNPGTAGKENLAAFRKLGVNRISIGVQSFQEEELRLLGRIHSAEQARVCVRNAREAGFDNLSLDLMSALPGQSYESWMANLQEAVRLAPEHISAYSLILEEGTAFWHMQERGELPAFPEEELDRRMYHDTVRFLEQYGYHRYEISNYAKEGCESRHNSGYWTGHPYLGFGLGAASYLGSCRWSHTRDLESYCSEGNSLDSERSQEPLELRNFLHVGDAANPAASWNPMEEKSKYDRSEEPEIFREIEWLTMKDQMAEFMFLGLRRMEGVSEKEFCRRFGVSMEDVYGKVLKRYTQLGLLQRDNRKVALTESGIDVCNGIMADFLID